MTTMEVAKTLVDLLRSGRSMEAIDTLYGEEVVRVPPQGTPVKGLPAVRRDNEEWYGRNEVHGGDVKGPFPNGDRFALYFNYDFTPKAGPRAGRRLQFQEVGLYTVDDGKIVREEFFYSLD